jgi:hypothetical protein
MNADKHFMFLSAFIGVHRRSSAASYFLADAGAGTGAVGAGAVVPGTSLGK